VTALANVPALVVTGRRGAGKTTLIGRLLTERPPGATWAALLNERGEVTLPPDPGVVIAEADGGCPCCTAQLAFRVGLTRLLRDARPSRLFIELGAASHAADVLRTLRGPWLAPVIDLEGVVHLTDGAATGADESELAGSAAADLVCARGDAGELARLHPGKRVIDPATATVAAAQGRSVSELR
jgi:G3E family GTPase